MLAGLPWFVYFILEKSYLTNIHCEGPFPVIVRPNVIADHIRNLLRS